MTLAKLRGVTNQSKVACQPLSEVYPFKKSDFETFSIASNKVLFPYCFNLAFNLLRLSPSMSFIDGITVPCTDVFQKSMNFGMSILSSFQVIQLSSSASSSDDEEDLSSLIVSILSLILILLIIGFSETFWFSWFSHKPFGFSETFWFSWFSHKPFGFSETFWFFRGRPPSLPLALSCSFRCIIFWSLRSICDLIKFIAIDTIGLTALSTPSSP